MFDNFEHNNDNGESLSWRKKHVMLKVIVISRMFYESGNFHEATSQGRIQEHVCRGVIGGSQTILSSKDHECFIEHNPHLLTRDCELIVVEKSRGGGGGGTSYIEVIWTCR